MKQFSETYYPFPKNEQWKHEKNNLWFKKSLETLKEKQLLIVDNIPFGPKYFNKEGEEVDAFGKPVEMYSLLIADFITKAWGGMR